MPVDFVETITFASPMHDVGKIGIPDCILLKADRLTPQEFEIMKTHTTIGEKILSGSSHYNIQVSASVALNHHTREVGRYGLSAGGTRGGDADRGADYDVVRSVRCITE